MAISTDRLWPVHRRVVGGRVTPTFLSASSEAFLPREPRGRETSQLAGSKAGVTNNSGMPQASASRRELLTLVCDGLRKLATHKMAREAPGQTLQPTALAHEAWLKLVAKDNSKFEGRAYFLAAESAACSRGASPIWFGR